MPAAPSARPVRAQATAQDAATRVRTLAGQLNDPKQGTAARRELGELVSGLPVSWAADPGTDAPSPADVWAYVTGTCLLLRPSADRTDGSFEVSAELLADARAVALEHGDAGLRAWLDYEASAHHARRGETGRAEEMARSAIANSMPRAAGEAPSRTEFAARHLLAEVLRRMGRWDDALAELADLEARLDSEDVRAALGDAVWLTNRASLFGARGDAQRRMGLPDRAAPEFELERGAAQASGDPRAIAAGVLHRADLRLLLEQFGTAASEAREALAAPWSRSVGAEVRAQLRLALGIALSERAREGDGGEDEARRVLEEVAADPSASLPNLLMADVTLADLALRAGEADLAQQQLERARARTEDVERSSAVHELSLLTTQEARLALARGGADWNGPLSAMRAAFADQLDLWSATPVRPGGIGFLNLGNRRQVLGTLMELEMLGAPGAAGIERALGHWFGAEALGSLARSEGLAPATLAAVRAELLAPGRGVLVYLPSKERSHLFAVDGEHLQHFELPSKDALRRPVQALLSALTLSAERADDAQARGRALEQMRGVSRALGDQLLPPGLQERLRDWEGVTVVGLELLGNPPLECLAPAGGAPLGTRLAIDRLPSLAFGLFLARRAPATEASARDLVLAANLEPSAEARALLGDLPPRFALGAGDLASLTAAFEPERVLVLEGARATPAALFGAARGASVLHVLAHGLHDPERERGAALALAGEVREDGATTRGSDAEDGYPSGGIVGCAEIEAALFEAPALVVLSACGAARAPLRFGDDRGAGLAGAFLGSGARCVVQSPRAVEYGATLRLMSAFHAELREGRAPAEAMRVARRRAGRDSDPLEVFYFAQFEVLGLGHAPLNLARGR